MKDWGFEGEVGVSSVGSATISTSFGFEGRGKLVRGMVASVGIARWISQLGLVNRVYGDCESGGFKG